MKVCAYCRVSTEEESQQSSYELQVQHYTQYIQDHENWTLQGIYADEGISGTSVMHRKQFLQMIEECKEGKINLIVTKSISRFARNVLDCISYVRQLKLLNPPVGAFFEMEGINSLDPNSEMILTILSIVAQEESKQKSDSLKWSYRRRFAKGIPVNNMWAIMGYDTDEQGNIFIVEKEAEIVRFMFKAYLEGKSTSDIAEALTIAKVPTPKGKEVWQVGVVCNILHNEKYIGEMRMQKTITVDLFTHKIKKNRGLANQYVVRNYHAPIVTRSTFATIYDDDNYYLICYYGRFEGVVHYRIDRMDRVEMVVNQPIDVYNGEPIDLKRHKKTLFGMFQGEEQLVEFQADASILDPIFDIFGDKVEITSDENGKLRFKAAVQLSPTFYGWCLSFGDKLQVDGPNEVVEKVVEYIHSLIQGYKRNQG